jgi:hypothetical protein
MDQDLKPSELYDICRDMTIGPPFIYIDQSYLTPQLHQIPRRRRRRRRRTVGRKLFRGLLLRGMAALVPPKTNSWFRRDSSSKARGIPIPNMYQYPYIQQGFGQLEQFQPQFQHMPAQGPGFQQHVNQPNPVMLVPMAAPITSFGLLWAAVDDGEVTKIE